MKKLDEAIERFKHNAEYERTHGNLQGCLEFKQLAKWLEELRAYREMYHKEHAYDHLRSESEGISMDDISDILIVSFENGLKDKSALCVTRKSGGKFFVLKMELGEQADILYRLLTEQMTKAEIKAERSGADAGSNQYIKR